MVLRITHGRFDPARIDDVLPLARQAKAAIEALPGNQNTTLGLDRTTGETSTTSTWDTAEHAQFTRETVSGLGDIVRSLQALGVEFDPPEVYEIVS